MSEKKNNDAIKVELSLLEVEFKNNDYPRLEIQKAYSRLMQTCGKKCQSKESFYFDRI